MLKQGKCGLNVNATATAKNKGKGESHFWGMKFFLKYTALFNLSHTFTLADVTIFQSVLVHLTLCCLTVVQCPIQ